MHTNTHNSCFLLLAFGSHLPSRFYRWAWCKDSGAGLESVWCDQSVPCSPSQLLLRRLAPLWCPMLHSSSYSQAALHHGGGLQGAHIKCVSSHVDAALPVNDLRCVLFFLLDECSTQHILILTGNFGAETSSQTCSSSALPFSSRSLAGSLCRNQGIQWVASSHLRNTMSHLLAVTESSYLFLSSLNSDCWLALSVLMWFWVLTNEDFVFHSQGCTSWCDTEHLWSVLDVIFMTLLAAYFAEL